MELHNLFWIVSGGALALCLIAAWAEKRRSKRKNLDKPGWVPWPLIQVLAIMGTVVAAALAVMT